MPLVQLVNFISIRHSLLHHDLIFAGKYFKEGGVTVESSRSLEFTLGELLLTLDFTSTHP
jgi:hypothetical protein